MCILETLSYYIKILPTWSFVVIAESFFSGLLQFAFEDKLLPCMILRILLFTVCMFKVLFHFYAKPKAFC